MRMTCVSSISLNRRPAMLVPVEWLKDYTKTDKEIDTFCERMIMSGSNIETSEVLGCDMERVVVGRVIAKEKHPDADKLSVCKVDVGEPEPLQIVCGAPNIDADMSVPVALHGSTIPGPLHGQPKQEGGVKIKKGKLRGVESMGMICSCSELGFDDKVVPVAHRDGIWILPEGLRPGTPIEEALEFKGNAVVDFEITPNRPDCLSMVGMAREAAATFEDELTYPDTKCEEKGDRETGDFIAVEIKNPDACKRYTARIVTDVVIGQSPWWMQKRLMEAGMRPINNIVDITNFVMLEYGQPIHAFDIRQIEGGKIVVENAEPGEKFTTLDETERELTDDMLLIKDGKKGVAIAGVMGGLNSEIEADTKTILIESANFDADSVRKTSKALGLRTEASSRFEKGIDPNLCEDAADRVCRLCEILGAGKVAKGRVDVYPNPKKPQVIAARVSRINRVLGTDIDKSEMINIFKRLEMDVSDEGDILKVTPPTVRMDMQIEEDCIEEVARIYGYDNLPVTLPGGSEEATMSRRETLIRRARNSLCAMGANEIETYSFVSPKGIDDIGIAEDSWERAFVKLVNPLGEENSVMRTMLMPGMLETLGRNYARNIEDVKAFEIGSTFMRNLTDENALPDESDSLCIGLYGKDTDFFTLKGMVTELLANMGITSLKFTAESEYGTFHPGRCARVSLAKGEMDVELAIMGELHPDVAQKFGIGVRCYVAEFMFGAVVRNAGTKIYYKPLPKYPATLRDIALIVDEDLAIGEILELIGETGGKILEKAELFDVYRGEQVEEGKKSVAIALTYRDAEKTLTDEETNKVHDKVLNKLRDKFNAVLREI